MRYESEAMEAQAALTTAARMCAAARTSPKAHGKDTIHTIVLTGEDKDRLADEMEKLGTELMGDKMPTWYGRDANNVRASNALVLIGADRKPRNVPNCGTCGFKDCAGCAKAGGTCAVAFIDLGIALAAAESVAKDDKVDCRIMFSVGKTAEHLQLVPNVCWQGIPISITGKDIFRDRGITHK